MKKLKTFDRVMLILLLVGVIAFSVWVIAFIWGSIAIVTSNNLLDGLKLANGWKFTFNKSMPVLGVLFTIIAAFFIFVSVRILFVRKRDPQQKEMSNMQSGVMLRNGEHGAAYITKDAIQYLVDKQVRSENSIRDAQSQINITPEQNVKIQLKISVMADQNLPEITGKLQESLKTYIQSITGIAVESVEVLVAAPTPATEKTTKNSSKLGFEALTK